MLAPASDSASAIALPSPLLAPVINAALPESGCVMRRTVRRKRVANNCFLNLPKTKMSPEGREENEEDREKIPSAPPRLSRDTLAVVTAPNHRYFCGHMS